MAGHQRNQILVFLVLVIISPVIGLIPEAIGSEFSAWCKENLGDYYFLYLGAFFFIGTALILYFTTDLQSFFSKRNLVNPRNFNIKWSRENVDLCEKAEKAIEAADPEEALRLISRIEDEALKREIHQITSQLTKYRQDVRLKLFDFEQETIRFNQIVKSTLELIQVVKANFATAEKENQVIYEHLKSRYHNRLAQKLARRQPINLKIASSRVGTSEETSAGFVTISTGEAPTEIHQIFQRSEGRLLIVGAPGAGKTCLLLQLGLKLLEKERFTIPVLLNLATWQESHITIENWLEEVLPAEIGINTSSVRKAIQESKFLLLLDGFDEVNKDYRASCLEAIGRYGEEPKRQFVITSRIEEYKSVFKDAPVNLQIEIGPLTYTQIQAELERMGHAQPEAMPLLAAMKANDYLREVVKIPFYFNVLQLLFGQGVRLSDFNFSSDSEEKLKKKIIDQFIEFQLKPTKEPNNQKWLAFLASRMTQRNMVVFELADLQYDWWKWSKWNLGLGYVLSGLVEGLFGGIVFSLFFGVAAVWFVISGASHYLEIDVSLIQLFLFALGVGFVLGLIIMLHGEIVMGFGKKRILTIHTREKLNFSRRLLFEAAIRDFKNKKFFFVFFAIVLFLLVTFIFGYIYNRSQGFNLGKSLIFLFTTISCLLVLNMGINLITIIANHQTNHSSFTQKTSPFYRFKASAKNLYFSILQHRFLCYQLHKQGKLPRNLVPFLSEMSKLHILETDEVAWRFRHGLIQEFFTKSWTEEGEKINDALYYENLGELSLKQEDYDLAIERYQKAVEINPKEAGYYNRIGNVYDYLKKEYDQAIEWYKKAIEIDPKYVDAYNNIGIALKDKGDYEQAIEWFKKAIGIDPKYVHAYNGIGAALREKGEYDQAIEWYQKAIGIDPKYVDAYNNIGAALGDKGDYDQAMEWFEKAIGIDPKYVDAYNNIGAALGDKGDYEQAIEWYQKAIGIDPKYVDAYNNIGIALKDKGDYGQAIEWYQKAIGVDPKYVHAYNNIGDALREKGDYDEAIEWYKKAIGIDPKHVYAYNSIGAALGEKGEYDQAIEWYQKAIGVDPKYVYAYNNIGIALKDKGDYDQAMEWFEKAIGIDPKYVYAYNNIGAALGDKGEYDQAIEWYQKAIGIDPKYVYAYNNIGIALKDKGDYGQAIEWYQKAIGVDPKYVYAYNNIGAALGDKGDYEQAIEWYQKAIGIDPKYVYAYNNIGIALKDKGDYGQAIEWYQKAIGVDPKYVHAYNNIGDALREKGDYDEAIEWYKKAIGIDPKHVYAYNSIGAALGEKGEYDQAIEWYQKAIGVDPKYVYAYNNIGIALKDKGDYDQAMEWFEKAIGIDPKYVYAYNSIGAALGKKGEYDQAIAWFEKAIGGDPKNLTAWGNTGWVLLIQYDLLNAESHLHKAWKLSEEKSKTVSQNLGHLHLLQSGQSTALEWYRKSLPLWDDVEEFFEAMESDYLDLKMSERGITREAFNAVIQILRNEINNSAKLTP